MKNKMKTTETEYFAGDETIDTIIVNDYIVIYCHYKNGYYSIITGINSLLRFLAGDVNGRLFCSDDWDDIEKYIGTI